MNPLPSRSELKGEALLLGAAFIWGVSFVAQRQGMESLGPFAFNALRFLAGGLALLIPAALLRASARRRGSVPPGLWSSIRPGLLAGILLCAGAGFQQAGIAGTTAGNAGFVTGIYVILVPAFGLFLGRKTSPLLWLGALLALAGLWLLSAKDGFLLGRGDLLVLAGTPFWALHILLLDRVGSTVDGMVFSITQFLVCAALSAIPALAGESPTIEAVRAAAFPLSYSAFLAIGLGYTLQVFGQRGAHPARASIILCMEGLFAVAGGSILLGEAFTLRVASGSALMLLGMILAQLGPAQREAPHAHP